ncbi:MAG: hypothetical protein AAB455_02890 [Patescibacteria group bacterium]
MRHQFFIIISLLLLPSFAALAYVAASTNYRIQADSINIGGQLSTSNNYKLEDTVGEVATGDSSSTNYKVKAGYQAMFGSSISISAPSDVTLSSINNIDGGGSTGSVVWTVTTDNGAGYTLAIAASTNPALRGTSGSFDDYAPSGAVPDYLWSLAATAAEFGFSIEGTDTASRYLDNGSACGVGASQNTDRCWDGLSTTNRTVASRASPNSPAGTATTVKLQAEIGTSNNTQPAENYSATITATALAS